ncbi:transcription factor MYB1R1 [Trifolium pratense]|uniref:transcription factor MYB1R1 n=1 Tax=Trifolium pratense TaxID=57577 RepID=UPI001E690BAF|nr:transcription factor MYB1R1 [Trifolium pratense]
MSLSRTCSHCGNNGHNSRTCNDGGGGDGGGGGGENSIMIFGVRLTAGTTTTAAANTTTTTTTHNNPFRKSASMTNLSQYQQQPPQDSTSADAGYVSDDVVHASGRSRERKRGVPWTEEEHKLFLLGLQQVGKGDWRGISRNFVKTRTPTQVASHAQKYFLRRHNQNRRRRRSSLFDITTDTVMESSTMMKDEQFQQETVVPLPPPTPTAYPSSHYGGIPGTPFPIGLGPVALPVMSGEIAAKPIRPTPMLPPSSKMANLNLKDKASSASSSIEPFPLSLNLHSSPPSNDHSPETSGHSSPSASSSAFNSMSAGNYSGGGGDSIISVA